MGKKKDLNLQPLEPQSTVLPIELYLPFYLLILLIEYLLLNKTL